MKQMTFADSDYTKLDNAVNTFEETNVVRATQCYYANGLHVRVLFYEVRK